MRLRRLLVLSCYPLLGEGLRSLLSDQPDLTLLGPLMLADVEISELETLAPDLLLIAGDDEDGPAAQALLLAILQRCPDLPVILVSLSDGEGIRVYASHRLPARRADLLDVIRSLPVRAAGNDPTAF